MLKCYIWYEYYLEGKLIGFKKLEKGGGVIFLFMKLKKEWGERLNKVRKKILCIFIIICFF